MCKKTGSINRVDMPSKRKEDESPAANAKKKAKAAATTPKSPGKAMTTRNRTPKEAVQFASNSESTATAAARPGAVIPRPGASNWR